LTRKLLIKPTLISFILGIVLFGIAPLGLGLSFVETLRPVLIPGVTVVQLLGVNTSGSVTLFIALLLNGVIYSILVLSILATRSYLNNRDQRGQSNLKLDYSAGAGSEPFKLL